MDYDALNGYAGAEQQQVVGIAVQQTPGSRCSNKSAE